MTKAEILKIEGIDDTDKVILGIRYDDARTSYTEIAERVGLTRPAVKNRIIAMEEKGIITAYRTIINPVPEDTGIKFMLTVSADPKRFYEVADAISLFKIHRQVYSRTGVGNIVAFGYAADAKAFREYENTVYERLNKVEGVIETSLHQLISTYKDVDGGVDYDATKFKLHNGSEKAERE